MARRHRWTTRYLTLASTCSRCVAATQDGTLSGGRGSPGAVRFTDFAARKLTPMVPVRQVTRYD